MLAVDNLTKSFKSGSATLTVVNEVSFSIEPGTTLAIMGPSGSGKTTLLGLCAGLDTPTSGSISLNGHNLQDLDEDRRAFVRAREVGFVFQSFQLMPTLTALENVMIPLELQGAGNEKSQALEMLGRVGLADRVSHYPAQLSGGEQQRVAIARAFINQPVILFADEPTGNLDAETGAHIEQLLFDLNTEQGTTLVIVTHDTELGRRAGRTITLRSGRILTDEINTTADLAPSISLN